MFHFDSIHSEHSYFYKAAEISFWSRTLLKCPGVLLAAAGMVWHCNYDPIFLRYMRGETKERASPNLVYIKKWQEQIRDYKNNSSRCRES